MIELETKPSNDETEASNNNIINLLSLITTHK